MNKRVFFGFEAYVPWPDTKYPSGRLIAELDRHMTVAFLPSADDTQLEHVLPNLPLPEPVFGMCGYISSLIYLPSGHPHVVAAYVEFLDESVKAKLQHFHKRLNEYLIKHQLMTNEHKELLPHVTICRSPFDKNEWHHWFHPLPVIFKSFNLYESTGNLHYPIRWKYKLKEPFIEIEHTADIAYKVFGVNLKQLYLHALTALAFRDTHIATRVTSKLVPSLASLDDVIIELNKDIGAVDEQYGCGLKAVSFHGELKETTNYLEWEMIVDV